jgi:hypothetical protein
MTISWRTQGKRHAETRLSGGLERMVGDIHYASSEATQR